MNTEPEPDGNPRRVSGKLGRRRPVQLGTYPPAQPEEPVVHLTFPWQLSARCGRDDPGDMYTARPADVTCRTCISRMTRQERFEHGTVAP
jgi:hypothetical protein